MSDDKKALGPGATCCGQTCGVCPSETAPPVIEQPVEVDVDETYEEDE